MTPKEKAIELVEKYKWINYDLDDIQNHKEGALICVYEIIKNNTKIPGSPGMHIDLNIEFWQEVEKEIEKL
jgi:hypothetical protein